MRTTITFEGDYYNDRDAIKLLLSANDLYCKIDDARRCAKQRLKHGDDLSDAEIVTLEAICEELALPDDYVV